MHATPLPRRALLYNFVRGSGLSDVSRTFDLEHDRAALSWRYSVRIVGPVFPKPTKLLQTPQFGSAAACVWFPGDPQSWKIGHLASHHS